MNYNPISPAILNAYVNFKSDEGAWNYTIGGNDMYHIQAKGTARIWNLLTSHQAALLADEVGMGKTIQALAVMVTLWRQNPNARVLVYVPNQEIALKWLNEYTNFIRGHYRPGNDLLKRGPDDDPVKKACYCSNHIDLLRKANDQTNRLLICKISSLSHFDKIYPDELQEMSVDARPPVALIPGSDPYQQEWMQRVGRASNRFFYRLKKGKVPFELLLVDESHYLRTIDRPNNRSRSAKAFFKNEKWAEQNETNDRPIAAMTLLMTATPNHSSSADIVSMLGFFRPELRAVPVEDILKKLCVRRFRRLQGMTKHQYRKEIPEPVALKTMPEKLFFAAYQKSLVQEQSNKKGNHGQLTQPYRILFGYLEGFEFLYRQTGYVDKGKEPDSDFETAPDKTVLNRLVKEYHDVYGADPSHPKYDKLIRDLSPIGQKQDYRNEKALVFVRRIPSVFEISRRVLNDYDHWFIGLLEKHLPKELAAKLRSFKKEKNWPRLRKFFNNLKSTEEPISEQEPNAPEEDEMDNIPTSYVLDLFVTKKKQDFNTTDCSNFKVRLSRRESVFSIFFQPAADYAALPYAKAYASKNTGRRGHPYLDIAKAERFARLEDENLKRHLFRKNNLTDDRTPIRRNTRKAAPDTLLGLWLAGVAGDDEQTQAAMRLYSGWLVREKEAFSAFLQKGIVQASPFIVHLYCFFKAAEGSGNNISSYKNFCKKVGLAMNEIGLRKLINEAVISFPVFYKKEMAMNLDELGDEKWNLLNSSIPVYPYCGLTKRGTIIKAFNTPFFPNVLVATSVLQEGVDLHYHCSRVIHYGIAWTPGDNEQRVGRVDRMMGKLDHMLGQGDENVHLPILYPYLAGTLDQDQVSRFIKRKHKAETVIDNLGDASNSKELDLLDDPDKDDWKKFFREPERKRKYPEPFGVDDSDFEGIDN